MGSRALLAVRRTRKFRTDTLVHLAYQEDGRDRPYKILCTNFWVYARQVELIDEYVTCLNCIAKDTL